MRRACSPNGEKLFAVTEILSAQQISSFFSRLAVKGCQQEVQVTEQDVLAVEEQVNFSTARDTFAHITHPQLLSISTICVP